MSLNSTMVRLKHNNYKFIWSIKIESQFHYGSIKTKEEQFSLTIKNKSQFHYGSIKTSHRGSKEYYLYGVSIPLWFD